MSGSFAIISVRNSSTRLPGKALREICGVKTIEVAIERAKKTGVPVVIATSTDPTDGVFEQIAADNDVHIFRGSLLNRLKRWKDCFDHFDIERAVWIDGDDLLHDYEIEKRAIKQLIDSEVDLVKNPDNIVCSYFIMAMNRSAVDKMTPFMLKDDLDLDVITEFLYKGDLSIEEVALNDWEKDRPFRLTLDYEEDLSMFETLIGQVGIGASGKQITDFLDSHPEVVEINVHRQKDFLENQQKFNQTIDELYSNK